MGCNSTQCLSARADAAIKSLRAASSIALSCLASPPGGAVQRGRLKTASTHLRGRLLVSRQSGKEPHQAPQCGCRSNTMARDHTNPGFMDDLKHLGQPFVPFVCRHLRKNRAGDHRQWSHQCCEIWPQQHTDKNNVLM